MPHSTRSVSPVRDTYRIIDLPCGCQTLIDEEDWPRVQGLTLYRNSNGYVYFSVWDNGKQTTQSLHVFFMQPPSGMVTDHINGNPLDNRRSVNLRVVTQHENQINRHRLNKNNKTGIRGVNYYPNLSKRYPWQAQIGVRGKRLKLGMFATKDEAIAARKAAEIKHYGKECS